MTVCRIFRLIADSEIVGIPHFRHWRRRECVIIILFFLNFQYFKNIFHLTPSNVVPNFSLFGSISYHLWDNYSNYIRAISEIFKICVCFTLHLMVSESTLSKLKNSTSWTYLVFDNKCTRIFIKIN